MKLKKLGLLLSLPLTMSFAAEAVENANNYSLEQVVVFSRHGLRAPLASPNSTLGKVTPNQWPQWDTTPSYLTNRGGVLEAYFGHYFSEWLVDNKLLADNTCPTDKDVYIYTNSMQRTIATGQYFAVGAFPGCIVPVVHKQKINTMDPTFFPVIRDSSPEFKEAAIASMNATAGPKGLDGLNEELKPTYQYLSNIIKYKESANCVTDKQCDFVAPATTLIIEAGKEPGINGPLRTGTSIADAFILQYYEGAPLQDVAWGQIKTNQQFEDLVAIKEHYNTILFGSPVVAKQVAANLVKYINNTFTDSKNQAKFTFLSGHDSNVASLFSSIGIKPYVLPNQFETTPIGGKVVFERWKDNNTGKEFMKIEYVYQSTDQIRNLEELNRNNPPQRVTLEMAGCPTNEAGYCPMDQFQKAMSDATK
ncbi:bifunctional glucose-1-phosphatase/inositol phosphatase [Zophobihabitans entericus]|uniref:Bifunctional glucose-1-phosphatase/inositol phosphatase n=1 Tax=Zophobihabitans entericus TaxID=1635327 RepID=A0A6G9I9Y3_9GAMM|nr:bifunctional glucose-1-phosphatase/inositol phosphatase [Zophobihabitans entericus]QIQ21031.1 bifunctional glucose-1-phosphatase/inositol phosphatase [Zophobihabitans entericus]